MTKHLLLLAAFAAAAMGAAAQAPKPATDLQATAKGYDVTLSCILPTEDVNGDALPVISKIEIYRASDEPINSVLNVSTDAPFTFVEHNVPAFSFGWVYGIVLYNGDMASEMQAFPKVMVKGDESKLDVPAASTDLAAAVDGPDVTISFTLPTRDVNGNALDAKDLRVSIYRSTSGVDYDRVFYARGENIPLVDGKVVWTDKDLYNNFYRYRAIVADEAGEAAMTDGTSDVIVARVNVKTIAPMPVTDLKGKLGGSIITLSWTKPVYDATAITLDGYEIYCDDELLAEVGADSESYPVPDKADADHSFCIVCKYTGYDGNQYVSANSNKYEYVADGICAIEADAEGVEFYTLQGVRVSSPSAGLYIAKHGGKASKVYVK